jgi:hypothetical protein
VGAEIEDDGAGVVCRVGVVGDDELEGFPVDRIVVVREQDTPWAIPDGIGGGGAHAAACFREQQIEPRASRHSSVDGDAGETAW